MTGVVKTIVRDKGFGFIRIDGGGDDMFFHRTGMASGVSFDDLAEGTRVQFEEGESRGKGPRAEEVELLTT